MSLACSQCGTKNNDTSRFCQQCGAKVSTTTDIAAAASEEILRQVLKPFTAKEIAETYPYTPDRRYQSMPPDVTYRDEIPEGVNLGIDDDHGALLVDYDTSLWFITNKEVFLERDYIGEKDYVYKRHRTGIREFLIGKKPLFGSQKKRILAVFPHVVPGRYDVHPPNYQSSRFGEKVTIQIVAGEVGMLDLTEYKSRL